ncbi:hypothetical protein AB0A74_00125 [Saccharothrix sp. NPDC042600]|uniref:hypothetical protein n=1 Tax=Saccharothrix TaxID=2071 RepID=UPI0033F16A49
MLDESLIGHWTDRDLYPHDPEYSELVFRADGTGWTYWCSWSTAFTVERFRWRQAAPGVVEVRLVAQLSGTWSTVDGQTRHEVQDRQTLDTTLSRTYRTTGDPLALELDGPIETTLGGTRFTLVSREAVDPVPAYR